MFRTLATLMFGLLLTSDVALATTPKGAPPAAAPAPRRELRRRSLTIDDSSTTQVPEIHVAGGVPTVLTFPVAPRENGAFVADGGKYFYPLQQNDKTVIIVPKADVPAPVALNVATEDGTVISFKMLTVPTDADVQIDIVIALSKKAAPDSPAALRASISLVRGQLDECLANSANAGIAKMGALILAQNPDQPQAFDRRRLSGADRQNRLLVQALWQWKLFGLSYVLFRVENRDPTQSWVLDRVDVKSDGGGQAQDLKVLSFSSEFSSLPPDTSMKVVMVFNTPSVSGVSHFTVSLLERDGGRHVKLEGLEL